MQHSKCCVPKRDPGFESLTLRQKIRLKGRIFLNQWDSNTKGPETFSLQAPVEHAVAKCPSKLERLAQDVRLQTAAKEEIPDSPPENTP